MFVGVTSRILKKYVMLWYSCSLQWQQHGSMVNGSLPVSQHHNRYSPDHSPRRLHRRTPDLSPYRVRNTDRSPLRQQPAARAFPAGQGPLGSWIPDHGSSFSSCQNNGLTASAERMDVSEEKPLNLSTGVRRSASSAGVENRRRIFTSGKPQ